MSKLFLKAEIRKQGDTIEFIASDETLDRHGDKVPIDGWDLKNYKRNPVLLVNHDYRVQNIVGKAKNLRVEGKKLIFEPQLHELTDLAKEVTAMVQEGYLSTVSVGFLPHWPDTEQGKKGGAVMNELLEISFVPVPANPRAERIKSLAREEELEQEAQEKLKDFLAPEEEEETVEEEKGAELDDDEIPSFDRMDDIDEKKLEGKTDVKLSVALFKELVGAAEKLKTLSTSRDTKKGRAKNDEMPLQVLKLVAKEINQALYKVKRQ